MKVYAKREAAQEAWEQQAQVIRKGEKKSMLTHLEERGLVQQIAGSVHAFAMIS
jgi:hypothetical protein